MIFVVLKYHLIGGMGIGHACILYAWFYLSLVLIGFGSRWIMELKKTTQCYPDKGLLSSAQSKLTNIDPVSIIVERGRKEG